MPAILLAVENIVHQVDGARQRAEDQEGERGAEDGVPVVELVREDERGKNKEILRPLIRTKRDQEVEEKRAVARRATQPGDSLARSGRTYSPPAPANFRC